MEDGSSFSSWDTVEVGSSLSSWVTVEEGSSVSTADRVELGQRGEDLAQRPRRQLGQQRREHRHRQLRQFARLRQLRQVEQERAVVGDGRGRLGRADQRCELRLAQDLGRRAAGQRGDLAGLAELLAAGAVGVGDQRVAQRGRGLRHAARGRADRGGGRALGTGRGQWFSPRTAGPPGGPLEPGADADKTDTDGATNGPTAGADVDDTAGPGVWEAAGPGPEKVPVLAASATPPPADTVSAAAITLAVRSLASGDLIICPLW